jgi:hypothetical protein
VAGNLDHEESTKRNADEDIKRLVDELRKNPDQRFRAAHLRRLTGVPKSIQRHRLHDIDVVRITEDATRRPWFSLTAVTGNAKEDHSTQFVDSSSIGD